MGIWRISSFQLACVGAALEPPLLVIEHPGAGLVLNISLASLILEDQGSGRRSGNSTEQDDRWNCQFAQSTHVESPPVAATKRTAGHHDIKLKLDLADPC